MITWSVDRIPQGGDSESYRRSRRSRRRSVGLPPGAQVQLEGDEGILALQTGVEDVEVDPSHSLQVVLQHHLQQQAAPQKKKKKKNLAAELMRLKC